MIPRLLCIYPNSRGFGFVCIELPTNLLDYGVVTVKPVNNVKNLDRVEKYLDLFKPHILLLRDPYKLGKDSKRIKKLLNEITELAVERNLPIHYYSREQVQYCFEQHGAFSKYEMSQNIAEWIEALQGRAPLKKKFYEPEDYNMAIFDAASLAVCYGYYDMK